MSSPMNVKAKKQRSMLCDYKQSLLRLEIVDDQTDQATTLNKCEARRRSDGRYIVNNYKFMDYRLLPYSSAEQYADALSKGSQNGGVDGIIDEIPYIKAFLSKYSPD
ncbi:hypothetical protein POM88_047260 [Heracleum sosnowskyi]|uniref:Uncharacterized protein n=1 Tax=Heracleum sosnowskyi TaxID=360622 RepID=A0AAD8LZF3_9APIA|nr:hypothetical protein POM88_047260 [Heracleum sosnowskyi]